VVALIVLISVLPILIEMYRERKAKKRAAADPGPATAIGVVAAATVAGIAESIHDEIEEHTHPHHAQQDQHPRHPGR
jgi:membrane-associated protein